MSLVYLDEVCDSISNTLDKSTKNIVLINTSDVFDGKVLNHEFVPNENIKGQFKKLFRENDILYSEIRPANKHFAFVDFNSENYVASTKLMVLRAKEDLIHPKFLFYILKSNVILNHLQGLAESRSGTFPQITFSELSTISINLPSLSKQRKILCFLDNIEHKIENLNKINHNLDALCHIIFKHYFIDFTPFIDKGFVDSEIGEIPKEWAVTTVGNILDCKLGGTPSRSNESYWDGDIAWINSGKINEFRIIEPSEYITEEGLKKSATKLLPAKTTVIAITGATLGQISLLEIDSCANQSVIGVIPNKEYPYEFVYPLISSILDDLLKHQTGGAQQHINKNNVESFNIVCPPKDIISKYTNIVSPLYSQISTNCFEIEKLQKLRDTLLPKLMSGEIDVSKINCDLD